mmetsp:Transcript_7107/g.10066  ORF Transcript_7107/g.10066 Transcript_7107/m.10066 type:complete len:82 (-) Transcript_7107:40-285(-)
MLDSQNHNLSGFDFLTEEKEAKRSFFSLTSPKSLVSEMNDSIRIIAIKIANDTEYIPLKMLHSTTIIFNDNDKQQDEQSLL